MNNIKSFAHVFGCVDNYKSGHSNKMSSRKIIWTVNSKKFEKFNKISQQSYIFIKITVWEKYFLKNISFNYSLTLISKIFSKITTFFWPLFQKNAFLNIFLNLPNSETSDLAKITYLWYFPRYMKKKSFWNFFGKSIFIRFS